MKKSEDNDFKSSTEYGSKTPLKKITKKKDKIIIKTNLPLLIITKKKYDEFHNLMTDVFITLDSLK